VAVINISSINGVAQRTYESEYFEKLKMYFIQMEVRKGFGMPTCSWIHNADSMRYTLPQS
jgi:hypothetical protein